MSGVFPVYRPVVTSAAAWRSRPHSTLICRRRFRRVLSCQSGMWVEPFDRGPSCPLKRDTDRTSFRRLRGGPAHEATARGRHTLLHKPERPFRNQHCGAGRLSCDLSITPPLTSGRSALPLLLRNSASVRVSIHARSDSHDRGSRLDTTPATGAEMAATMLRVSIALGLQRWTRRSPSSGPMTWFPTDEVG